MKNNNNNNNNNKISIRRSFLINEVEISIKEEEEEDMLIRQLTIAVILENHSPLSLRVRHRVIL